MRILLLNQAFHPDVVATAQYLTDVALALTQGGHEVTVLTGASGYDDPGRRFPAEEEWQGIRILRIRSIRFRKDRRWTRAVDFGLYTALCAARLAVLPPFDVVVALTSPPLIASLARWFVRLKGGRFVFWVMDLNPDEAIAAGWLRAESLAVRLLDAALRRSLRAADVVVALDRFMRDRIVAKGTPAERVMVLPPWSQDDDVLFDAPGRHRFRLAHGLDGKFVVMYSGNHSPCNPLDTWFAAAELLRDRSDVQFCCVGGGTEFARLRARAQAVGLPNVTFIAYQPRSALSATLSAADLHVVSLGDPFVGILHPSKVYNVLRLGLPILFFGTADCYIGDLAINGARGAIARVPHGDVVGAVSAIREAAGRGPRPDDRHEVTVFSQNRLLPVLVAAITGDAHATDARPL
jgi:glycosyltransferase involved in cell wall biosynthesis